MSTYEERQAARKANIIKNAKRFHEPGTTLGVLPVQFGRAGEIFADAFSAGADWIDHSALPALIDKYPGLASVTVATVSNTIIEGILNPVADLGRLGKSFRDAQDSGNFDPAEMVNDAFRLITVITHTPEGKAVVQQAFGTMMTKLSTRAARLIRDGEGGICQWVAGLAAGIKTGQIQGLLGTRLYMQLDDLARALKITAFKPGLVMSEMIDNLRRLGAVIGKFKLGKPGFIKPAELGELIPRDGSVGWVVVKDVASGKGHAVITYWENGVLKVMDRGGNGRTMRVFENWGEFMLSWFKDPRKLKWQIEQFIVLPNLYMKNVAGELLPKLVIPLTGLLKIDPQTALDTAAVQKAVDDGVAPVPVQAKPNSASAPIALEETPGVALPPHFRVHVVQRGDTLSALARRFYGRLSKWPILFVANRAVIGPNPNLIRPGQILWVPEIKRR